jgi:cell division protein FtsA
MSATRLEVETHVVTAATSFIENVVKCVQRGGLQIEEIVVEPLATGLAVLTDAEQQLGVALADIGGGTTDVALFADGAITHTTIIPVGGNHVSYDLSVAFRLSPEDAERLRATVEARLEPFAGDDGLTMPGLARVVSARAPR